MKINEANKLVNVLDQQIRTHDPTVNGYGFDMYLISTPLISIYFKKAIPFASEVNIANLCSTE